MLQLRRDPDLAKEALGADGGRDERMEHLDGDETPVTGIPGEIDGGHAAATELPLELVVGGECGGEKRARHGPGVG